MILMVGVIGVLGRETAHRLLAAGHEVRGLALQAAIWLCTWNTDKIEQVYTNNKQISSISKLAHHIDYQSKESFNFWC